MSQVFTAKQIAEEALGAIGAFPVTESAADPEHLRRAMTWLDLILAEIGGNNKIFALIPATLSFPLINGQSDYNLNQTLGANLPPEKIQNPVEAWLEDQAGNRTPIEIATFDKFEAAKTASSPSPTGPPCLIHIDRLADTPILRTFPAADVADTNTYTLKLAVQTYAPNVAPAGVTGTQSQGAILTKFRQAWQRYLILQLAHDLGSGPIFKIAQTSLDNFAKKAGGSLLDLKAYENREHDTEDPVGEPNGLM